MRVLSSLTFLYDPREDRILAAINAGQPQAWACWLTRRLTLAALREAHKFLDANSPVAQRAAVEYRHDVVAFERTAAIASTAGSLHNTPAGALQACAAAAERATSLRITRRGDRFQLELHAKNGEVAGGLIGRDHLQRILFMLEDEVKKAEWISPADASPQRPGDRTSSARWQVRH